CARDDGEAWLDYW
nr:immunoglobulin heavy chain junction region [Macaca mulatta]MOW32334.1 immunoglobulin heavy chain junction region [Macaca mulatta]MOW32550.1 immunoglobulin heavy chain junction region [Macaca mulatta]MOW33108.1 immunoglobulin heavy chain junction region [Macaca mulatta]MOW33283.1 immunoglobulin heavy chain junction region [Macaca mulatta]